MLQLINSGLINPPLEDAVENEDIVVNPLVGWKFNRQEPPKADHVEPFIRAEQAAILSVAKGQDKNFIQFAFWSGLRTSGFAALTWDDIDFVKGEIRINKAKTKAADQPEVPKTKTSIRTVKLLPPAREALIAQKKLTTGLVFINAEGTYLAPEDINNDIWKPTLKKADVKYRNPYQTRHTYASMMLSAGEPLAWVSKQMGHSSIITTARRYVRWIPESDPLVGNRAVEMFK